MYATVLEIIGKARPARRPAATEQQQTHPNEVGGDAGCVEGALVEAEHPLGVVMVEVSEGAFKHGAAHMLRRGFKTVR